MNAGARRPDGKARGARVSGIFEPEQCSQTGARRGTRVGWRRDALPGSHVANHVVRTLPRGGADCLGVGPKFASVVHNGGVLRWPRLLRVALLGAVTAAPCPGVYVDTIEAAVNANRPDIVETVCFQGARPTPVVEMICRWG